ncbi:CIA30-domain-containing protein [Stereum hirsutum FP-91666 SS1]|uniref:CIA30-domain-containing protein n=1 Tax=Stereum hirsutum (strain FP-91666) TaxID=721885 RepID=UPI000440B5F4|nr:CIA30-domain-containing protein [Stereum hirsutum FP-91666 SS1]EIM92479.1 CIA30-domain-containing protein [Stereum hirsutum FP-91666 SS1]
MHVYTNQKALFGGNQPWVVQEWTASDDRVRGGKSQSYLSAGGLARTAVFHGNLDITALGGAGFASQRTATNTEIWNLAEFDGLLLDVENADDLRYTLTLKDTLLPPDPDTGREQSTISYEYDFSVDGQIDSSKRLYIPWSAFRATYRGRDMPDAPSVNLKSIRRFSFMVRSFFGDQQGNFSLSIRSLSVTKALQLEEDMVFSVDEKEEGSYESNEGRAHLSVARAGWLNELWRQCTIQ